MEFRYHLGKPINTYLTDVKVTYSDWFDTLTSKQWQLGDGSFTVQDGLLSVNGDSSAIGRLNPYIEGQGSIISFKMDNDSNFQFFYEIGTWGTDPYKMYGYAAGPRNGTEVATWFGKTWAGRKIANPKPDTWYNLLLAMGKSPKFLLVVWERDSGAILYSYSRTLPDWSSLRWNLYINSFYGHVEFDNFADIKFSGMK